MVRRLVSAAALMSGLALAACAGTDMRPTQVTRFHLGQPIAPGNVAVEPRPGSPIGTGPEFQTYAAIVAAELTRLGFAQAPDLPRSELVAVVDVQRGSRVGPPRSGLQIGLGGGSFGGGWGGGSGVGGGVSFPVGGNRGTEVVGTMLNVQLKRRSDQTVIWEGRAMTEGRAGTAGADPDATVRKLAAAMFRDFPGQSGRTITVK